MSNLNFIDTTSPILTTLAVQTLANATQVVYRATFDEAILGLTASNFGVSGSTATVSSVIPTGIAVDSGYTTWDITVSGGNFGEFSGDEILSFANTMGITDVAGNAFVTPATTVTAVVNNAVATPVTLTSFLVITGGNEDTEQTITFTNLMVAGDEASTAGAVNVFVIKTVSTGTLKIGTSSATATTWTLGTNDVVDATHNIYWTPATNANGTLNAFTALAKESGGQTSSHEVQATVSVMEVNDKPTVTVPSSTIFTDTATFNNPQNRTGTITATDPENQTIIYGIKGGTVSGLTSTFTTPYGIAIINISTGEYTFIADDVAINALSTNTSYNGIIFTATDSGDLIDESAGWGMTLNAANDTPIISAKNITGLTDTIGTDTFVNKTGSIAATDAEGTALTYNLTGSSPTSFTSDGIVYDLKKSGTYGDFYIKSSTGDYVYDPDDVKMNAISSAQTDTFTVTASDGGLSASNTVTVNFGGTNDMPILATPASISFIDTTAADIFTVQTGTLSATDAENNTLIYGISTGTVSGGFATKTNAYGTLSVNTSTGYYTFTPNNAAINALSANVSPAPYFSVSVSDGTSIELKNLSIDLTWANDAPVFTTQLPITLTDTDIANTFSNQTGTIRATDAEGTALNYYGLTGSSTTTFSNNSISYDLKTAGTYGDFYIKSSTGEYVYAPNNTKINAIGANQTETFTVSVSDGNLSSNNTITVNLNGVNDKPTLTTPTSITLNDTSGIDSFVVQTGTLSAIDAESTTLSYGISGGTENNGFITQVGIYGTLTIKISDGSYTYTPNNNKINSLKFGSNPTDTFTVNVSDGSLSDSKTFIVNLTGATDMPVFVTPNVINLVDTTEFDYLGSPTDQLNFIADEGTTLKYGIAGVTASVIASLTSDYGDLVLDVASGFYSFIVNDALINALPADSTHSVNFNVTASYGGVIYPQTLTVNVTGANDAPLLDTTQTPALVEHVADLSAPTGAIGILVSDFVNSFNVSDIDTGANLGVALTAVGSTKGSWFYSTDNGTTWTTVSTVSDATPLLLDTNNRLYFKPNSLNTIVSDEIVFKAWDKEVNSQFSTVSDSITVELNLKPVFSNSEITLTFTDTAAKDTFENSTGTLVATDINGDSLIYGIKDVVAVNGVSTVSNDYGSLSVNATGGYTFVPNATALNALKTHVTSTFTVTVSDGYGTPTTQDLTIDLIGANDAPLKTGTVATLSSGTQEAIYVIQAADLVQGYTDADGDTLSVSNLVADNTGTITLTGNDWTFTPTTDFSGTVHLTYDISDDSNSKIVGANQNFTIILIENAQGAQINTAFSYSASAIFSGTESYSATSDNNGALPSWLHFNTSTGLLSGTPTLSDLGAEIISITKNGTTKYISLVIEPFKMGNVQISSNPSSDNTIVGGTGIDTVSYFYSFEPVNVTLPNANAGSGNLIKIDNLVGSSQDDTLTGNKFANTLDGGIGVDTLAGGLGNDVYIIQDSSDVIIENAGVGTGMDSVFTFIDAYTLADNVENLTLLGSDNLTVAGNTLSNLILGNSGNNTIISNGGGDWLKGGKGDDIYILDYSKQSNVTITENVKEGTDSVEVKDGTFTLPKYVENLTLTGTKNNNGIGNDDSNNIMIGNDGSNKLYGLKGNDTLNGGLGSDTLTGGAGKDVFQFSSSLDATNVDTITDFVSGTDKIALSQTIFAELNTGTLPASEIGNHILYSKTTGGLSYDEDGSAEAGIPIQIALLGAGNKHFTLLNTDFIIV